MPQIIPFPVYGQTGNGIIMFWNWFWGHLDLRINFRFHVYTHFDSRSWDMIYLFIPLNTILLWQSSPWRPPPTRPLASCYRCHYTQWSPQKDWIKIRALVVELLHLKERGQKCDTHTHTQTLVFIGRALLRNMPFKNGIKIRAFVAELLHLKERGNKYRVGRWCGRARRVKFVG